MKVGFCNILFCIMFAFINSSAQVFTPLISSPQQETVYFADLLNEQILSLNHFYSHYNTNSKELIYDTLLLALPSVNSVFSSFNLYNNNMHLVGQVEFPSTADSIFIYQNFAIQKQEFSYQPWEDEIVLFGTLLTPNTKTRVAVWLDYDLNIKRKIVYHPDLYFYIKSGGISSHFMINNAGNLMTNVNGATVELNNKGEVVKRSKYLLGRNYFQNRHLNYLAPFSNGLSVSDRDFNFVEFEELSFRPLLFGLNFKYIQNSQDNFIMVYIATVFDSDCNGGDYTRNGILKYDTNTYEAELFYIADADNCNNTIAYPVEFGIDNFTDDYIYICRKINNCKFIDLDANGENTCTNEFIEIQCIDQNGQLRWQKNFGGDAAYLPKGIVATADSGCVVFTNRYANGINTDKESDLYYVKLDKLGNIVEPLPVSVNELNLNNELLFYPNPAKTVLHFKHNLLNTNNFAIKIYNLSGKLVLSQKVNKKVIQIGHLAKGIYTCTIKQNQKVIHSQKLIKF